MGKIEARAKKLGLWGLAKKVSIALAVASIGPPSMVTKAGDFNEWYNEVVDRSGLRDKRYPVKGMDVWTPYGWAAMTRVDNLMRAEMERTNHGEVNFPLLVPETEFRKEGEHIRGFEDEVY